MSLVPPTLEAAYEMGAKGSPIHPYEQKLFEAYMSGRRWERTNWSDALRCYEDQSTRILYAAWRDRAALGHSMSPRASVTRKAAKAMGRSPSAHREHERLLFESYMRGHCWAYGSWSEEHGGQYRRPSNPRYPDMTAQMLYLVWRDRAALEQPVVAHAT